MFLFEYSDFIKQVTTLTHNGLLHAIGLAIFFDILTGTLKSFKHKKTSSSISLFGISKHLVILLLILVINIYLPLFGFNYYAQAFTGWMFFSYLISLTENWGELGLPLPNVITKSLAKLKDEEEEKMNMSVEHMEVKESYTEEEEE